MNGPYTLSGQSALADVAGYGPAAWEEETEDRGARRLGLALWVWAPTFLVAGALIVVGQVVPGVLVLAAVALLHSLVQPRVAIYALVAIIPVDWMFAGYEEAVAVSKLVGVVALLVSLPRLIPTVFSLRWDPCAKWIVVLCTWAGIACMWAAVPWVALVEWQTMILNWGILVLVGLHLRTLATVRTALVILAISCFISSLTLIRINDPRLIAAREGRRGVTTVLVGKATTEKGVGANVAARLVSTGLLASFYLLITTRGLVRRLLLLGGIATMALALVLLKSRITYVAIPASLVGGMLLLKGAGVGRRVVLALVITIVGAAVAFAMIQLGFIGKGVEERFQSIFEEGFQAGHRGEMWGAYFKAFFDSGFMGKGLMSLRVTSRGMYAVAHNDWLSLLGELGIIGVSTFFAFHLTLFLRMRRVADTWAQLFCLMVWLYVLLAAMTSTNFYATYYTLPLALVLAMVRVWEARAARGPDQLAVAPG